MLHFFSPHKFVVFRVVTVVFNSQIDVLPAITLSIKRIELCCYHVLEVSFGMDRSMSRKGCAKKACSKSVCEKSMCKTPCKSSKMGSSMMLCDDVARMMMTCLMLCRQVMAMCLAMCCDFCCSMPMLGSLMSCCGLMSDEMRADMMAKRRLMGSMDECDMPATASKGC